MKSNTGWFIVIVILLGIIAALLWVILMKPSATATNQITTPTPTPSATPTPAKATPTPKPPLHDRVHVTSPVSGGTVGKTFAVTGEAPGNWYFEAVFPIQVRDASDNVIGHGQGQAQSDWMTTAQVSFKATITLDMAYKGPATLILLKDNPSGIPENDDAVSIPITIQ